MAYLIHHEKSLILGMTAFIDSGQTCCLPILLLVVIVFIIKLVLCGLSIKKPTKGVASLSVCISHSMNCGHTAKVFKCLLNI